MSAQQGPDMSSISSVALSGMNAAQFDLQASAQNLANLSTAGYRRQLVSSAASSDGGVSVASASAPGPGNALATDVLGLSQAKNDFAANLAVFRAGDQMLGTLIDLNS
jgi:flagellar hook protein FlgE